MYWLTKSSNIQRDFRSWQLKLNSNVFACNETQESVTVHEVYKVDETMPILTTPVGVWSSMLGLVMTSTHVWERRSDLQGITLTAAIAHVTVFNVVALVVQVTVQCSACHASWNAHWHAGPVCLTRIRH